MPPISGQGLGERARGHREQQHRRRADRRRDKRQRLRGHEPGRRRRGERDAEHRAQPRQQPVAARGAGEQRDEPVRPLAPG
ncbi:MAG: hypothetical protein WDN44_14450 [Sphingomonas sp.]